ncbi:MAG: succinate dehydrogenase cytochrome b subunit [Acidobacteria bacterium]|nr:succinate dehydrogenase cytochrome b subunit [Acidobacteriota bacterium]MBI3657981.1 succinate dehydrogenase cytochrome b subunit [Acidobacteriota bacterium]
MQNFYLGAWSSIGKKFLMGFTGLLLAAFVTLHLLGNLTILLGKGEAFNQYAHALERMQWLVVAMEIGLAAVFLIHIVAAVFFVLGNRTARPLSYQKVATAGNPSRKSASSATMIYTGVLLLAFTVSHLKTFKFGPGMAQGYAVQLHGETVRDLYRLVVEIFSNKWYVIGYVVAMILLGFHLRHGFWSAFQSLGVYHPRFTPAIRALGVSLAVALAFGFVFLPLWVYVRSAQFGSVALHPLAAVVHYFSGVAQ